MEQMNVRVRQKQRYRCGEQRWAQGGKESGVTRENGLTGCADGKQLVRTYRIARGLGSVLRVTCLGRKSRKEGQCVYMQLIHCAK